MERCSIKKIKKACSQTSDLAGQGVLEDVALRPGAFDYLKLPIAIQEGRVGKLKVQVILVVIVPLRIKQPSLGFRV